MRRIGWMFELCALRTSRRARPCLVRSARPCRPMASPAPEPTVWEVVSRSRLIAGIASRTGASGSASEDSMTRSGNACG